MFPFYKNISGCNFSNKEEIQSDIVSHAAFSRHPLRTESLLLQFLLDIFAGNTIPRLRKHNMYVLSFMPDAPFYFTLNNNTELVECSNDSKDTQQESQPVTLSS